MRLIDVRRFAVALVIGTVLLAINPTAAAANEPGEARALMVGGRPLAELLRTAPTAPFIAFESSLAEPGAPDGSERHGRKPLRTVVSAANGAPTAEEPIEEPAAAFQELPLLVRPGDRVTVTDHTGRELQGKLIDLSPSALSVLVDGTRHDLPESDVNTIRQRRPDSVKNGALVGFLSGAALGGSLVALSEYGNIGAVLGLAGIYGGMGAGVGAIVDSMVTGSHVVYDARRSSRRVSVAPLLSRDQTGVAVSLGF